jgi:hypothetical protein
MAILDSELKVYKSIAVDDTSSNGGRLSSNLVTSGVVQNVFPHALKAERDAGSTKYRKTFIKVANDADETLLSAQVWLDKPTAADDWAVFWFTTQRSVQSDITGSERKYGCANLSTDAVATSSTLIVTVEDSTLTSIYQSGDTIRVTNKLTPTSGTGNEEFLVISGAPSVVGTEITITTTTPLANGYTVASGSRVMSVYEAGNVECTTTNWVETSSAGTYDEVGYPIVNDNIGTVEQTWTLTFSDAANFTCSGDTVGAVGSGMISSNFSPNNPTFSKPYLNLLSAGFGGTWATGDTIVFQTHPAAVPIWEKRVVPAGAGSLSSNSIVIAFSGESA